MKVPIYCFTSDKHLWALQPFAYLHNKYWDWPVIVAGYTPPEFKLPGNFAFVSIGKFEDYPFKRWSDGVIKFLETMEDEIFIYTMEDFWLLRQVDTEALEILGEYMLNHPEVARIDLSTDRLYAGGMYDYEYLGRLDLIANELPVQYLMSFQIGMWRKSELLKYLIPGESPNECEIAGSGRMNKDGALVLGTRQFPIRYLIAIQFGKLTLDGGYQYPTRAPMRRDDIEELKERGFIHGIH